MVRPYLDGDDVNQRRKDRWVIDFGTRKREDAERYLTPFAVVQERIEHLKTSSRSTTAFWTFVRARAEMRAALNPLSRFIVTSEVSKHRIFAWAEKAVVPSGSLVVIAADDDFTFGVLSSSIHALWAWRPELTLEDRPRYPPSVCFDTFPFPHPSADAQVKVERWAVYLVKVRDKLLAADPTTTLTDLYTALEAVRQSQDASHPAYALLVAQNRLDEAVAAAYGWIWPIPVVELLTRLLALNQQRLKVTTRAKNVAQGSRP